MNSFKLVACVVLVSACSKLPIHQSSRADLPESEGNTYSDQQLQLRYHIENDNRMLYVVLETPNRATQLRMVRNGVKIYFDAKGKKSKSNYFNYPVRQEGFPILEKQDRPSPSDDPTASARRDRNDVVNKMLSAISPEAILVENGVPNELWQGVDSSSFSAKMTVENNTLIYRAQLPLAKVAKERTLPSIGIVIEGFGGGGNVATQQGGNWSGAGMRGRISGGRNSVRIGGMSGGMRRGGMTGMGGGNYGGGGMRNNPNVAAAAAKSEFWFRVQLK
ncbi:MAG: hypothetical protein U0Y10_18530 [Spirosomataceae bacterium]